MNKELLELLDSKKELVRNRFGIEEGVMFNAKLIDRISIFMKKCYGDVVNLKKDIKGNTATVCAAMIIANEHPNKNMLNNVRSVFQSYIKVINDSNLPVIEECKSLIEIARNQVSIENAKADQYLSQMKNKQESEIHQNEAKEIQERMEYAEMINSLILTEDISQEEKDNITLRIFNLYHKLHERDTKRGLARLTGKSRRLIGSTMLLSAYLIPEFVKKGIVNSREQEYRRIYTKFEEFINKKPGMAKRLENLFFLYEKTVKKENKKHIKKHVIKEADLTMKKLIDELGYSFVEYMKLDSKIEHKELQQVLYENEDPSIVEGILIKENVENVDDSNYNKDIADINESILNEAEQSTGKRKQVEDTVLTFMSKIDKTGKNTDKYRYFFKGLDDNNFNKWIKQFLDDPKQYFQVEALPFEDPVLEDVQAALKYLKVPLEEYMYYRHDGYEDSHLRTRNKVPVGYLHIKRVQQILSKKNKFGLEISEVSATTGQHTGDSKGARNSDWETWAMSAIDANKALEEMLGPRADNKKKKLQMYNAIAKDGYAKLADLESDLDDNLALNTINSYLTAGGLNTDLVTDSLRTYATIKEDLKK